LLERERTPTPSVVSLLWDSLVTCVDTDRDGVITQVTTLLHFFIRPLSKLVLLA
jgi:hypothetical protein